MIGNAPVLDRYNVAVILWLAYVQHYSKKKKKFRKVKPLVQSYRMRGNFFDFW